MHHEAELMPADLFQTQYGGWFSNLSWQVQALMALMLVIVLLDFIPWDSISAYLNWDKKRQVVKTAEGLEDFLMGLWLFASIVWSIYCVYQNISLNWDLHISIFNLKLQFKLNL